MRCESDSVTKGSASSTHMLALQTCWRCVVIEYRKGSLFEAPKGSYLVHACNTQGVWGSGIAVEFKKRFPGAFAHYNRHCQNPLDLIIGKCWCMSEPDYIVTCLMVSTGY